MREAAEINERKEGDGLAAGAKQKAIGFFRREPVLVISFVCAAASMAFVPPSEAYGAYFDWKVLSLLFCLMAVVAGLQECNVFAVFCQRLLTGRKRMGLLSLILVLLPFFASMLITNDVALITFVPFTIVVLSMIQRRQYLIYLIVLQTIAANLGSMAAPVGNPQSLFLYEKFHLSAGGYFRLMLPFVLASLVCLAAAALLVKNETIQVEFSARETIKHPKKLCLFCGLFALSLLGVFRALPYPWALGAVVIALLLWDRPLFARIDYGLLLTFLCFFVFAGNMGNIGEVREFLNSLLERSAMLTSLLASQVISNVPAAVLLSGFTQDGQGLLVGTNLGGLGTLIASLASLISFRYYLRLEGAKPLRYLDVFTGLNLAGLAVLTSLALCLSLW